MKILHVILGKADKSRANGVNQVIAGLAKYTRLEGASVRVLGMTKTVAHEGMKIERDGFVVEGYSKWDKQFREALSSAIAWSDVVHLHGVYSFFNLRVGRICVQSCRPFVVTLHDGLAPERARSRGRVRKWLYHNLLQRRHLQSAAAIHVIAEEEATDLFGAVKPGPVFCIPNGVDLDDFPVRLAGRVKNQGEVRIGYIGRLSKEKNLDALCQAFGAVKKDRNLRLVIAGPNSAYGEKLRERYSGIGVEWTGPKYGQEKIDFIGSLALFVHPSLCEVFSIGSMEALAVGTPLLITRNSKASYFYDRGAFFMCETTAFGLERGLRHALDNRESWEVKASAGRRLVEERFNWSAAAKEILKAYEQILAGAA